MRFPFLTTVLFDDDPDAAGGGGGGDGAGADAGAAAAAAAAAAKAKPDPKDAEIEALRKQITEKDANARYWFDKAKGVAEPKAAAAAAEPEDQTDLLDLIGTKGAKGLNEWLSKNGFVKAGDVDATVNQRATQMTREAELVRTYPMLADQSSEFFTETAKHFQTLEARGIKGIDATEAAAEKAFNSLVRAGKLNTDGTVPGAKKKGAAADDDDDEEEQERLRRVAAQAGENGRRSQARPEGDDKLNPEQKRIIKAFGISEESYKKRAKEGVQLGRQ